MSLLKPFRSVIPVANNDTSTYYVSMQPVACGTTSAKFVSANLTFQPSTQTLAVNKSPLIYSNTRSIFNLTTSPTPPLNPKVGDLWYDTSTDIEFEYIFDGVNLYWVDISSPVIPGTVQFVYRTASGAANANILYALADSVNNYSNVIEFSVNTTNFTDGTTIYWRDIGTAVTANTWLNITFKFTIGSTMSLYKNGNKISTISLGSLSISSQPIRIGRSVDAYWNALPGRAANLQIYNRELSDDEVLQNFQLMRTRFGV